MAVISGVAARALMASRWLKHQGVQDGGCDKMAGVRAKTGPDGIASRRARAAGNAAL